MSSFDTALEGVPLLGRLASLEGVPLLGRLASLEGVPLLGRLASLEGDPLLGRLASLGDISVRRLFGGAVGGDSLLQGMGCCAHLAHSGVDCWHCTPTSSLGYKANRRFTYTSNVATSYLCNHHGASVRSCSN